MLTSSVTTSGRNRAKLGQRLVAVPGAKATRNLPRSRKRCRGACASGPSRRPPASGSCRAGRLRPPAVGSPRHRAADSLFRAREEGPRVDDGQKLAGLQGGDAVDRRTGFPERSGVGRTAVAGRRSRRVTPSTRKTGRRSPPSSTTMRRLASGSPSGSPKRLRWSMTARNRTADVDGPGDEVRGARQPCHGLRDLRTSRTADTGRP